MNAQLLNDIEQLPPEAQQKNRSVYYFDERALSTCKKQMPTKNN